MASGLWIVVGEFVRFPQGFLIRMIPEVSCCFPQVSLYFLGFSFSFFKLGLAQPPHYHKFLGSGERENVNEEEKRGGRKEGGKIKG